MKEEDEEEEELLTLPLKELKLSSNKKSEMTPSREYRSRSPLNMSGRDSGLARADDGVTRVQDSIEGRKERGVYLSG